MPRSHDLRRFGALLTRIEQRVTAQMQAVRAARQVLDALVDERVATLSEAESAREALCILFDTRGTLDRRSLYALLHEAGQLRRRWRESLAQAALLETDIAHARTALDASRVAATAARRRADRLSAWLAGERRKAEGRASRMAHEEIEEDAWKRCTM
jgi:regulator of replication initiation timing